MVVQRGAQIARYSDAPASGIDRPVEPAVPVDVTPLDLNALILLSIRASIVAMK